MRYMILILLLSCTCAFSAEIGQKKANPSEIRIVPVRPTEEPDNVRTRIVFPKSGQVVWSNPVRVQVQLDGFNVGTNSDFERAKEIYNDPDGQSLLVFIDNEHPIEIYRSFVDSLDQNNQFFSITLTTTIPFYLKEGMHLIRAFPDRSYGESIKGSKAFAAEVFYIGSKKPYFEMDLSSPFMTYNEPLETLRYSEKKPILLDFYLSNVQLSQDGYKIRVTIDKDIVRSLTRWVPYYIYGLEKGSHTVRLELIDEKNEVVQGPYNDVSRLITVD